VTDIPSTTPVTTQDVVDFLVARARQGRTFTRGEHYSPNDAGNATEPVGIGFEIPIATTVADLQDQPARVNGMVRVIWQWPSKGSVNQGAWLTVLTEVEWVPAPGVQHKSSTTMEIGLDTPDIRVFSEQYGDLEAHSHYHMLAVSYIRDQLRPYADLLFPDTESARPIQFQANAFRAQAMGLLTHYDRMIAARHN
jgi:hypothetical protein